MVLGNAWENTMKKLCPLQLVQLQLKNVQCNKIATQIDELQQTWFFHNENLGYGRNRHGEEIW